MMNQFHSVLVAFIIFCSLGLWSCKETKKQHDDKIENEIDSLLTLTASSLSRIQIDSAEMYVDKALELCKKINYSHLGCMDTYIFKGQILYYGNNLQESLKYLLKAENEPFAKQNPQSLYEIYRIKGQIYLKLNLLNQTVKEFGKALSLVPKLPSLTYRANTYCMIYENLISAYNQLGDTIQGFQILEKYKRIAEETAEENIYPYKINAYNKVAKYFQEKHQLDSAKYYSLQAIAVANRNSYPYYSNAYITLGECAINENQVDSALYYFKEALTEIEARSLRSDYMLIYGKMVDVYEAVQMKDSAEVYRDKYTQSKNLIAKGNVDAVEATIDTISKEQEDTFKSKMMLYITLGIFIIGLAIIFLILNYLFYKRQIKKKEIHVNDLTKKVNDVFDEVLQLAKANDSSFLPRFTEVYSDFINALCLKHPNLNKSDLVFCAMKYLGFETKEIATITFVEVRSVQTKRSRLRKKLGLSGDIDFYQYLHSLE